MLTYLYRKRSATGFSIEKLFDALRQHLQQQNIQINRLEMPHSSSGLLSLLRNAWFIRRRIRRGILHITGDVHYGALLTPGVQTIITIHDCVALQRGKGLRRFVLWLLWYRLPVSMASAITVISEQTRRELMSVVRVPARKVYLIPNFVSPAFKPTAKDFHTALPRILHVGTRSNKNLARVVEALTGMDILLVIVGVLDATHLELLARYRIQYQNHPTPDDDQLLMLYQQSDLVSFPSTYEGFGMPIIEAQAIGRAVLTSNLEPMRTVAGDAALLVDPCSVSDIRHGFFTLLEDAELRRRLIEAGHRNAEKYSIDSVARQYLALYRQLT